MDFTGYVRDVRTQKPVAFNYAVIGGALNRLKQVSPDLVGRIPQLRQIVGFRNLQVHDFAGISQERVRIYSGTHLQQLQNSVRSLLAELNQQQEVERTAAGANQARPKERNETDPGSSLDPF